MSSSLELPFIRKVRKLDLGKFDLLNKRMPFPINFRIYRTLTRIQRGRRLFALVCLVLKYICEFHRSPAFLLLLTHTHLSTISVCIT